MANANEQKELAKEMIHLYRVFAALQTNALFKVKSGKKLEDKIKLAKEESKRLEDCLINPSKCPDGTIWDPVTGMCI